MKKRLLPILFISLMTSAQNVAGYLSIEDTRSANQAPSQYLGHRLGIEFKDRNSVGVPGEGAYSATMTITPWHDDSGNKYHQLNFNDGGIFYRNGLPQSDQWGDWNKLLLADTNGNVRISGGYNPTIELSNGVGRFSINRANCSGCFAKDAIIGDTVLRNNGISHNIILELNNENDDGNSYIAVSDNLHGNWIKFFNNRTAKFDGKILSREIIVKTDVWADHVFKKDYKIPTLQQVEKYIVETGHLPNIPSEKEVLANGINLGDINKKLLQKIEELTLYSIEQNKKIEKMQKEISELKKK